jgi:hypothetical protein
MQTFDESLFRLYRDGRIDYDTALANADSQTDFALRVRLSRAAGEDATLELEESPEEAAARERAEDPNLGWIDGQPHVPAKRESNAPVEPPDAAPIRAR